MLISSFADWFILPSQAAFEYMETSLCCSMCRLQSSFRLLTNVSLLHSMLEIRLNSSSSSSNFFSNAASCLSPIWTVLVVVFTTLGQLLYTVCFIIGIPVDSIIQRSQMCYSQTVGRCINIFQSGMQRVSMSRVAEADVENPPVSSSSSPRLNSLPTNISSTPLLPATDHRSAYSSTPSTETSGFYTNYGLGGAIRGGTHSSSGNGGQGYELVSQQAPDSHFTNAPIHSKSSAEEKSTMIEVTEDHLQEDLTKDRNVSNPPPSANNGNNSGSNQQYYHRSKQTSRLLNPELYGNNGNSKK